MFKITTYPNLLLKKRMKKIDGVDEYIIKTSDEMLETMRENQGIGIAANQCGLNLHMAIVTNGSGSDPITIINAEIVDFGGTDISEEGCLSLPKVKGQITRAAWVDVRYLGLDNIIHEIHAENMLAKCIQHEIRHLNGMTIWDMMGPADKAYNKPFIEFLVLKDRFGHQKFRSI